MSLFIKGTTAVITGAASGIGAAASRIFAAKGMNLVLADTNTALLKSHAEGMADGGGQILTMTCDVAQREHCEALADLAFREFGSVQIVMANAGISGSREPGAGSVLSGNLDNWDSVMQVNFNGQRQLLAALLPLMTEQKDDRRVAIICTGSKQGITNPPGNSAYNCSKAAVRSMTEHLAWELRQKPELAHFSAHLLVPGWTFTGMTGGGRTDKPDGAWTAEQVIEYAMPRLASRDFYIICPDNAVDSITDNARMLYNTEDIVKNRSALSRWSKEHEAEFAEFVEQYKK
ncbi:hypothetical protein BCR37DRAFT_403530 [Protomyces lactucae-debilis]|uniref:Short chain dehydrogenase/reductase n=1 Tax=Protomyces lactucae-debilis TaxID=2754530 RepID=A0A1Y2F1U1_PROLT|nr:uncharacterized protein BCR37DRAFT_403530 [Protomyces lactucae-debilis]ORY77820.1 hypothetical protein BCR37DRAFT_403530 [Protomyces lactucae-debilis]